MSLFYRIMEEHVHFLKEKGYEEKSTGSPDKEGWLIDQFRKNFSTAVNQSLHYDEPTSFTLRTTGFFNNYKNVVFFQLNYLFDPKEDNLFLEALEIETDGIVRIIPLQSLKDLPHSSQALKLIEEQKQINQNRLNKYRPIYTTKKGYDPSIQNELRKGKRK